MNQCSHVAVIWWREVRVEEHAIRWSSKFLELFGLHVGAVSNKAILFIPWLLETQVDSQLRENIGAYSLQHLWRALLMDRRTLSIGAETWNRIVVTVLYYTVHTIYEADTL